MTSINLKLLFKQSIIPIIIFIIGLLTILKWYDQVLVTNDQTEIAALLNLLPIFPYLLLSAMTFLAVRQNNRQLLILIFLTGFSYFILTKMNYSYIQKIKLDTYNLDLLLLLIPLNLAFVSGEKRPINTISIFIILVLLSLEIAFFSFMAKFPITYFSDWFCNFREEFPNLAIFVINFSRQFLQIFTGDRYFITNPIPLLPSLIVLLSFLILVLKFIINPKHFYIGNIFLLIYLYTAISYNQIPQATMLCFTFYSISLFILTIEANFSLAYIDELTTLPTRRKMNEVMQTLGSNYAIAMIDVDKFKHINDKFGHKAGDQALQLIASKLSAMKGGAKVFRFAGDEFTAIFSGKSAEEALPYLEEFRLAVQSANFVVRDRGRKQTTAKDRASINRPNASTPKLSVSIGIADKDSEANTPQKVFKKADKKLYKSKKAGRNKVSS